VVRDLGLVIVLGIVALGVRGLNLGIDFKGGTQLSFKTPVAHTTGRRPAGDAGAGLRRRRHPGTRLVLERRVQELPDPDEGAERRQS
jgi:preprotein translocase subunit SecF